ncbi:hypothetical protein B0T24DRAFT_671407, partial [Lasiosphaeria ovina]
VVAEAADYNVNLSTRAAEFNNDKDVPGAPRTLFSNLAALKFGGGGLGTIQNLEYHLAVVAFNTSWEEVKVSIKQGNAAGREILQYLIRPTGRGVQKVS